MAEAATSAAQGGSMHSYTAVDESGALEDANNTMTSQDVTVEEDIIDTEEFNTPIGMKTMDDSMMIYQGGSMSAPAAGGLIPPRAVHQCNICNKIFVSFKGLQQHSVIHTDQKPFGCDVCGKAFRFKSNLFEHRSVHSGFTPHNCPYCGKTCRLKGNLKKHLRTHVNTKDELDEAWKPFASNRRAPQEIPDDAIIVRSSGEAFFTPPNRPRKRKLGLGVDSRLWVEKIRRGEMLPTSTLDEKLQRLADILKSAEENYFSMEECFEHARAIPLERFDCPLCKSMFMSRLECAEHIELEHPMARIERPLFCDICLRVFADRKSFEQHESYHRRVQLLLEQGGFDIVDPEPQDPEQMFTIVEVIPEEERPPGAPVVAPPGPPGADLEQRMTSAGPIEDASILAPPHSIPQPQQLSDDM